MAKEYLQEMYDFLEQNKALLDSNNFSELYNKLYEKCVDANKDNMIAGSYYFYDIRFLTKILSEAGIDPLKYMNHVPKNYACKLSDLTSVVIPDTIKTIDEYAFAETKLKSITIPSSVKRIGLFAFENCKNLTKVTLNYGLEIIGSCAFYGCWRLTDIIIPDSVTTLIGETFSHCTRLKSVTLPKSLTSMGEAFNWCKQLEEIIYKGTKEEFRNIKKFMNWHADVPDDCKIICTDGNMSITEFSFK